MKKKWIYLAPAAIVGIALLIALGGEVVHQLWNWLLPPLFGWHPISFWQALGILALCRILFGGLGRPGPSRGSDRRMRNRWKNMTAEERERFREGMRERCGFNPSPTENPGQ